MGSSPVAVSNFCLGFILFLHFIINFFIIMSIVWSKQTPYTWSCLWNLRNKSDISEYLDQILPWNNFSEALRWKPLCLLKIKIKQSPGCPNKEYNAIFKQIHQNSRAYSRSKKMIWKILRIRKNPSKARRLKTNLVCSKYSLGSGRSCNPKEILQFLPSFKLKNNISRT